jgi:hypothetical protein
VPEPHEHALAETLLQQTSLVVDGGEQPAPRRVDVPGVQADLRVEPGGLKRQRRGRRRGLRELRVCGRILTVDEHDLPAAGCRGSRQAARLGRSGDLVTALVDPTEPAVRRAARNQSGRWRAQPRAPARSGRAEHAPTSSFERFDHAHPHVTAFAEAAVRGRDEPRTRSELADARRQP